MNTPHWLDYVLATHAHLNLDHPAAREQLAQAIYQALPRAAMEVAATATLLQISERMADGKSDPEPRSVASRVVDSVAGVWGQP